MHRKFRKILGINQNTSALVQLLMVGELGVHAWDLPQPPNQALIDVAHYTDLALRAATAVLTPWGIKQAWLTEWVLCDWYQAYLYLAEK